MYIVSLDLEMNQPSGAIIQVGAILGDLETGEVVASVSEYVKTTETIAGFITGLTGITTDDVRTKGVTLQEAYEKIAAWYMQYGDQVVMNPLTWGGGDSTTLMEQLKRSGWEGNYVFGRRWIDAKTVYVAWKMAKTGKMISAGLSSSMRDVGLKFQGRKHTAQDDALNTFIMYRKLLSFFK